MTDKKAMNVASQCRATASADLCKNILVDGGSGFLFELLLDAAKAIETLAQEKALQTLHNENERLGLYKDAYAEPVAWMFQHDETGRMNYVSNDGIHNPAMFLEMNPRYALVYPLYTTPPAQPAQRTEQEPVQYKCTVIDNQHLNGIPLEQWVKPPQRTLVGLTDEEIQQIVLTAHGKQDWTLVFARAIEAAHGIKENT